MARWREKKIFEKTLEKTRDGKPFVFYDGPPFATGEPHYGHVLSGTIKDAIPRYQTMRGRYVRRQWGWDCHGLPLENIIEQELKLAHKKDIEEYGVGNFNEAARKAVLRFDSEWKELVPRLGRFVDMDLSYKTMDASYSESIWWAFKTLYDKGLIYEGHKVMYVCPRCETPVSNFEVAQGYRDVTDISVTVRFKLKNPEKIGLTGNVYILAWTTTPWTLPGNVALAVGKDIEYIAMKKGLEINIVSTQVWKRGTLGDFGHMAQVTQGGKSILNGSDLEGLEYGPLFDYYAGDKDLKNREHGWKIYGADFVNTEEGTGIVHIAPAYGEDDMNLAREHNLPVIEHVGIDGRFKREVTDFAGMYVKQKGDTKSTDKKIVEYLKNKNCLFNVDYEFKHSYPLCWRCETPLINYATPSWFVKVTDFRDEVAAENKKIGWVPAHAGEGRFGKWLEGARDWAISRSRYWGAPLPVWKCAECDKVEVLGSVKELSKKLLVSGNRYLMMRHGESECNASRRVNSDPKKEDGLTEKGKNQVRETAEKFKSGEIKVDRIVSSDFARTKETALMMAEILGVPSEHIVFDPRLREINTGVFHNKTDEEYGNFAPEYIEKFTKAPEGGENLMDVKRRVLQAMIDIEKTYRNQTVLIVAHEYSTWMLYAAAGGVSKEDAIKVKEERGEDFLKNAEFEELYWKLIPRNSDGELDLHRPYIDEVIYDCDCGGTMKRIPDVFDCWFESGSMPYAQFHYPFENEDEFKRNFPADFIAEGMDQTRGWFYSLLVLSTALFGETPYKNVIVNGIILAGDEQKMSKRLKNYPEVAEVVDKYGADAIRFYLLSSPVVRGEDLNFSEKAVDEIYKKNIVRLNNVYAFYELYRGNEVGNDKSGNVLDKWIIARLNQLIQETTSALDSYELDRATRPIGDFIDDLSTWYIRRSRERFKGEDENDKKAALETTKYVLTALSKVLAPFMPFIADDLYLKVTRGKKGESVHLEKWPTMVNVVYTDQFVADTDNKILSQMATTQTIVTLSLEARAKVNKKVRQPLKTLFVSKSEPEFYDDLVADEINVKEVVRIELPAGEVKLDTNITPELKEEGDLRDLIRAIQDFRKKKGLTPSDRVALIVLGDEKIAGLVNRHTDLIKRSALLSHIAISKSAGGLSFQVLNPGS